MSAEDVTDVNTLLTAATVIRKWTGIPSTDEALAVRLEVIAHQIAGRERFNAAIAKSSAKLWREGEHE